MTEHWMQPAAVLALAVQIDGGLLSEFPSLLSTDAAEKFGKAEDEMDERGDWLDMPGALQGLPKYASGKMNMTHLVRF